MMPSPFASLNVYGRWNNPFTGKPTESRSDPVPIVLFGTPLASAPSDATLFVLCEPVSVRSQPNCARSNNTAFTVVSQPLLCTDARFERTVSADGAADAAIG